jgi:hypothetical protein
MALPARRSATPTPLAERSDPVRESQVVISGEIKERERRAILRRRTRRTGQFEVTSG